MPNEPAASGPVIFDRALIRARRRRAAQLGPVTFLLDRVADEFAERLAAVPRRFDVAADLGTPTGVGRTAPPSRPTIGTIIRSDAALDATATPEPTRVAADEETLPFR